MPCHHVQHTQKVGPNLFACNENSAYVMPCVTTCPVVSCVHCAVQFMQASRPPYVYVAHQELLMDVPFMQAE